MVKKAPKTRVPKPRQLAVDAALESMEREMNVMRQERDAERIEAARSSEKLSAILVAVEDAARADSGHCYDGVCLVCAISKILEE